jgi:hypothetical protein
MAVFAVDTVEEHEREQIQKYAEFVSCDYIGGYLITVRSIHHEPDCQHQPVVQAERMEPAGKLLKCSIMPNGVHVHLYAADNKERYMRFIEVSDADNEAMLTAFYG